MKYPETAARLSKRLSDLGMQPVELAEKSGISIASISQYINGHHAPGTKTAQKLHFALGGNPLWYMGFDVPFSYTIEEEALICFRKLNDINQQIALSLIKNLLGSQEAKKAPEDEK